MRCIYDSLPSSFSKVLAEINQHASDFNIESEILSALLIQPLISDNFNDAQQITDIRMDELRQACRENASDIMFPSVTDAWLVSIPFTEKPTQPKSLGLRNYRLLCRLSVNQLATFIQRFNDAEIPYQRTRWRVVLCGDDSLLVHAEESQQVGVVNIWSTLYKTYRKAHNLIALGVTIGPGCGTFFFPLWVELWRQPSLRKQTRPQRMAAALLRLQQELEAMGTSLSGIDFVVDNGYLSPVVVKAANKCGLVMTTNVRKNDKLSTFSRACDGTHNEPKEANEIRKMLSVHPPRFDRRAGEQGYYWRIDAIHPRLGEGTLVIQRRQLLRGRFPSLTDNTACGKHKYRYYFTQHQKAKGVTVLQIAKRRWPTEVFFREGKQKLGLGHLSYRKWSSLRGHIALRGLLYWFLSNVRRLLRLKHKEKTVGGLKRRFHQPLVDIFVVLLSGSKTDKAA